MAHKDKVNLFNKDEKNRAPYIPRTSKSPSSIKIDGYVRAKNHFKFRKG